MVVLDLKQAKMASAAKNERSVIKKRLFENVINARLRNNKTENIPNPVPIEIRPFRGIGKRSFLFQGRHTEVSRKPHVIAVRMEAINPKIIP